MRLLAPLLASITIAVGAAQAADIGGVWDFRTVIAGKGCTIEGRMVIGQSDPLNGERTCSFTSSETCDWFEPDRMPLSMEQDCAVVEAGEMVLIRSKVEQSLTDWHPEVGSYMADEFDLDEIGGKRMTGDWFDLRWRAPVVFERPEALPIG